MKARIEASPAGVVDLLHLSDLHFGPHSRFQGEDARKAGERFAVDLRKSCDALPIGSQFDLVVVTGDLAETGKPREFEDAEAFLSGLAGALGIGHERFVFVPGNHDISWPLCKQQEAQQEIEEFDEAELRRRIDDVKLRFYDESLRRFFGVADLGELGASPLGFGAWVYDFEIRGLTVSIAALNSCERESHRRDDHGGEVSKSQIQAALDRWRPGASEPRLRLVAVHHNPVATTLENERGWRDWLSQQDHFSEDVIARFVADTAGLTGKEHLKQLCCDCRVQLVLHGHQHAKDEQSWEWPQDGRTFVLSAGSLALSAKKLPNEEPLSVRLIRLDTQDRKLTAWPLTLIGWAKTKGHLGRGAFTLDPAVGVEGYRQNLSLPDRLLASEAAGRQLAEESSLAAGFISAYRRAMKGAFSSWELSVASGMTSKRQARAQLDDMYVPLRFRNRNGRPRLLEARDISGIANPLIVTGVAGSGKTTWIRHTFRRLVEAEHAFPLMVELRKVAKDWDHPQVGRSLLGYFEFTNAGFLGRGWEGQLSALLKSEKGPIPILLVDGWDELGTLGGELREKLSAFVAAHPWVRVVVTSRPFGESRPSSSEGFEQWAVVHLDQESISRLCRSFFRYCRPEDERAAVQDADSFLERLAAAPDARALAETPLLLTMLLMIGTHEPLPEKRHELYAVCLRNLLWARPKRREEEGVRPGFEHFCPKDSEARLRATAALAFGVQSAGYQGNIRSALRFSAEEAAEYLPREQFLNLEELVGFLAWLAESAGVLTDRSDNCFQFAHLSFQEFLAAWQLHATNGEGRVAAFSELGRESNWWETLVLWAALIQQQNPLWADEVIEKLARSPESLPLAGAILADGLGSERAMNGWLPLFVNSLRFQWSHQVEGCLSRWRNGRQSARFSRLLVHSRDAALDGRLNWLQGIRLTQLLRGLKGKSEFDNISDATLTSALSGAISGNSPASAMQLGSARILAGGFPLWPLGGTALGLLQLWPGDRRQVGLRLQSAAALGASHRDLLHLARLFSSGSHTAGRVEERFLARYWARDLAHQWANGSQQTLTGAWARDFAQDLAQDLALYWARDWGRFWARDWARDLVQTWAQNIVRYWKGDRIRVLGQELASRWGQDLARSVVRDRASTWASEWARTLAREAHLDPGSRWLQDYGLVEMASSGRGSSRALLLHGRLDAFPEAQVLQRGARESLQPTGLEWSEDFSGLDPIWPALARHIARRASVADRELLEDLAKHPEKREPPLSWGLQFIVRGDVVLDGGETVTLDDLFAEAGVNPLPYLEEMPPELDLDWGLLSAANR